MMAPYTIAHLKLGMTLRDMGYEKFSRRLGVYLTNSLEEGMNLDGTLFESLGFMHSITEEAREASKIKHEKPIMVVLGNPPYSGESSNAFYSDHVVYKVEPGGKEKLKEKNSKWINDDYVKFIRLAESMVEKNGEGVVGMVTSHGYIDNPTFRGMRWHLRKTFDTLYVLDLHGNSNKKEVAPDGGKDENVFDIKTGVAIIFGVKKRCVKGQKPLAVVYRADFYGTRKAKYEALVQGNIESLPWYKLSGEADIWKVEGEGKTGYSKGFSVAEVFQVNTVGVVTSRDTFIIDDSREVLVRRIENFLSLDADTAKSKYGLKENQKWKIIAAQRHHFDERNIIPISYRPFDSKFVYYHNDFIERSRKQIMRHYLAGQNVGLVFARSQKNPEWNAVFISRFITETKLGEASTQSATAPLYLYHEDGTKTANLKSEIVEKIKANVLGEVTPEDILDYIYAVLHSPKYRETYKEFLKIDFPRVPYPRNDESFRKLVGYGQELRALHLMESPKLREFITTFPESGSNIVEKVSYREGRVYINETQYFGNVPEVAWNFYIGGYQPAQKWLKDRKDRTLSNTDLEHYQKITIALVETDRIMKEIDLNI